MTGNAARVGDLLELAAIWRRRGLVVRGMDGWQDRGRSSTITFDVLGCHHTAAPVDIDRILRDGRGDLPGPLCNVALHADGTVVLVASGRANHFGVATWSSSRSLGVEATGPPFTNYPAYVQLAAGFCEWRRCRPAEVVRGDTAISVYRVAGHKEVGTPYGRKVDPAGDGFNNGGRIKQGVQLLDNFRLDVLEALVEHPEGDDMTTDELLAALNSDQGQAVLMKAVTRVLRAAVGPDDGSVPAGAYFERVEAKLDTIAADLQGPTAP